MDYFQLIQISRKLLEASRKFISYEGNPYTRYDMEMLLSFQIKFFNDNLRESERQLEKHIENENRGLK